MLESASGFAYASEPFAGLFRASRDVEGIFAVEMLSCARFRPANDISDVAVKPEGVRCNVGVVPFSR